MLAEQHGLTVSRETLRGWMIEAGLWLSAQQRRALPSAAAAPRGLGRAGADRRQRASLVRGSRRAMHPAGVHRRCDRPADAAALRAVGECLCLFRGLAGLSRDAWLPGRLLQRQAFGVPRRQEGSQGRSGHDPVRPGVGRAQHRDPVRQFEPGQGSGRAGQPDLAGPAGQGSAAGRDQRHRGRQRVPAGLHGALQRPLRRCPRTCRRSAPAAERRPRSPARILCHREQRHVGQQLTLSYERKRIMLEQNDTTVGLAGSMSTPTPSRTAGWRFAGTGCPCPTRSSTRTSG